MFETIFRCVAGVFGVILYGTIALYATRFTGPILYLLPIAGVACVLPVFAFALTSAAVAPAARLRSYCQGLWAALGGRGARG